jgi:hypothetical protein
MHKMFGSFDGTETAGYFQTNLDHADILLGKIIRKWHIQVVQECKGRILKVHIPEHSGHGFHVIPATDSISFRPLIPEESGQ